MTQHSDIVDFRAIEREARQMRAEVMAQTGQAILGWLRALLSRRAPQAGRTA